MRQFALYAVLVVAVTAIPTPEDGVDDAAQDICDLPPIKPGLIQCAGFSERWTYNKTVGECVKYIYGGCRGTENLFPTELACIQKCDRKALLRGPKSLPAACTQPLAVGTCKGFKKRFYFNSENGACEQFNYGGCRGNDNNFLTLEQCQMTCVVETQTTVGCAEHDINYHTAEQCCTCTICEDETQDIGNDNNFETLEQCQTTCSSGSQQPAVSPVTLPATVRSTPADPICLLPPIKIEGGISCLAFIPSWTFNAELGKCERYVYGGCGKTENLFPTEEACAARCVALRSAFTPRVSRDACLLPVEGGPCYALLKVYGFVKEKNRCEVFTYGGCKGNANRFSTADECYQTCGGDIPSTRPECEDVQCDLRLFQHYADRGCRPQYQPGACCPSRYVCPRARSQLGPQCTYRGVNYATGDAVPQITTDNPCIVAAFCNDDGMGGANFVYAEMSCDPPEDKKGCIPLYSPDNCCAVKYECPDGDDSSEEDKSDVCFHNGTTYVEGQRVPSGDPCKSCICLEGADGQKAPVCKDIHCLIDPPQPDCAPVYTSGVCCPTSYTCPNSERPNRVIKPVQEPGTVPVATLPAVVGKKRTGGKTPSVRPVQEPGTVPVATLPALVPGGKKGFQVNDERCLLPKEVGPCRGYKPVFYYDADQQQCLPFNYGGCKGNTNRFESAEQCWNVCKGEQPASSSSSSSSSGTADNQPTARHGAATPSIAIATLDACELPIKVGPCRASVPSFAYNAETKQCQFFMYGGCEGNDNRFATAEECENRCKKATPTARELPPAKKDICSLPAEVGRCRAQKPRYYFDSAAQECKRFSYGGCGGNENNFLTAEECASACQSGSSAPAVEVVSVNIVGGVAPKPAAAAPAENSLPESRSLKPADDVCNLPFKVGPCRARKTRFYFNSATQTCETFSYGGCDANENNFLSEDECLARCKPAVDSAPSRSSRKLGAICDLSADVGPCRGFDKRYFFNSTAQECQEFTYGGCRGNQNNFKSLGECQEGCGSDSAQPTDLVGRARSLGNPDCQLPADVGHCRGSETRFYFDPAAGSCKSFIFGGCNGNANNFLNQEECSAACGGEVNVPAGRARTVIEVVLPVPLPADDACGLPIAPGPCRGFQQVFGYNAEKKACESFVYGGCKGNANRFPSLEECQQKCAPVEEPVLAADECRFGNVTLKVGESLETDDPCDVCTCDTPPQVTCVKKTCPGWDELPKGTCRGNFEPGQCCPTSYGCVSSDPPVFNPCADKVCPAGQRCKLNYVNFDYVTECVAEEVALEKKVKKISFKDDECNLPITPGPCRGFRQVFAYNAEKKACEAFAYGGCQGNANRFPSLEECQQKCMPVVAADECRVGNVTLKLGEPAETDDPCDVCSCDTPPQVTCVKTTCPKWEAPPNAICTGHSDPGQCCPTSYSCVSSNPPVIDLCEGTVCPAGQRCKVDFVEGDYVAGCVAEDAADPTAGNA